MIDSITALRFLRALVQDDSETVFQTFDDNTERKKAKQARDWLTGVRVGPLSKFRMLFERINKPEAGGGIFIQINAGGRGSQHVTKVRALFADDDENKQLDLTACPPSIVVASAGGKHYYWLVDDCPVKDFKKAQKHLAAALGTDKSIHNADRVMRLPGTLHLKDSTKPFRVKLVECNATRIYHTADVLSAYPIPVGYIDPQAATERPPEGADATPEAMASMRRVLSWLDRRKIVYTIKPSEPLKVVLDKCVFNPEHRNDMAIIVTRKGAIWASCWHKSCGHNEQCWSKVRDTIGGWFGRTAGFSIGDHKELASRALSDLRNGSVEACVYSAGQLYRYEPTTLTWQQVTDDEQDKQLLDYSGFPKGATGIMRLKWSDVTGSKKALHSLASQPRFFDDAPRGIMFTNGFLRVDADGDLVLEPPSPHQRQRERMLFPYETDAPALRWLSYLNEVFAPDADREQKIALLQEFAGACLLGLAPRFQHVMLLLGEGGNGKSVFLKVIAALFPPKYRTSIRPQDFGHEYYRASLAGIRLNFVNELPEADILESEAVKAVVDGSNVDARHPAKEVFTHEPVAGHLFAANRLPGTVDFTHGFMRRFMIVQFNRRFDAGEAVVGLEMRIIETELAGVCLWALRGAERLLKQGHYSIPDSSRAAVVEWREEADVVAAFIKAGTTPAGSRLEWTQARDLYASFRQYLSENGHRVMSSTKFGARLKALNVPSRKSHGVVSYGLRVTYEPYGAIV